MLIEHKISHDELFGIINYIELQHEKNLEIFVDEALKGYLEAQSSSSSSICSSGDCYPKYEINSQTSGPCEYVTSTDVSTIQVNKI